MDDPCNDGSPQIGNNVKWARASSSFPTTNALSSPTDMSSAATGSRTPSSAGSDWRVCYVLCQHDYTSSDRDHLSFRKNEVLEIIKKENSGWWAALRGDHVGWIPSAFVLEISEDAADEERLYASVPVRVAHHSASTDSTLISTPDSARDDDRDRDWVPIVEPGGKVGLPWTLWQLCPRTNLRFQMPFMKMLSPSGLVTATDFPDDVLPPAGPLSPPQSSGSMDSFSTDSGSEPVSERQEAMSRQQRPPPCPRSPSTPMPFAPHSLKPKIAPLLINRPIPPPPAPVSALKSPARATLIRSRSDSSHMATAGGRSARRRPIMLSDRTSLSTLSLYIDSNGPPAADSDLSDLYGSYDVDPVRSPSSRRSNKIKQLTGDDDAQAFHNARLAQAALPWFLKPSYTRDDIKMEYNGSVRAGTVPALVERLTVDPLSMFSPPLAKQTTLG